jgi:hypothetical protein
MKTSEMAKLPSITDLLIRHEGLRLFVYKDTMGLETRS